MSMAMAMGAKASSAAAVAAPLLLLAAMLVGKASAAMYVSSDMMKGMQAQCNFTGVSVGDYADVINVTECEQCMIDAATTSTPELPKMFACHAYCQSAQLVNATNFGGDHMKAQQVAAMCMTCVTSAVVNPWACDYCIEKNPSNITSIDSCLKCVAKDPYAGKNNTWYYACAECAALTDAASRDFCNTCLDAVGADGGKCVYDGQYMQAIALGLALPTGIQSQCFANRTTATGTLVANKDLFFNASECIACMKIALDGYVAPNMTGKAYACTSYCQDPTLVFSDTQATDCKTCVLSDKPRDPWGCKNCMAAVGNDDAKREACFNCVQNYPFANPNYTNYNWACGECASIDDPDMRDICLACIANAGNDTNICDCVDLVKYNNINTTGALDPFQRSCYSNWTVDVLDVTVNGAKVSDLQLLYVYPNAALGLDNIAGENGVIRSPDVLGPAGQIAYNGDACSMCTVDAYNTSDHTFDKRYACRQYCQDPTLVQTEEQGENCAGCVASDLVKDPWGCLNCMTVTTTLGGFNPANNTLFASTINDTSRSMCVDCVRSNTLHFDNHAWGCGMCAQMVNNGTDQDRCFACVVAGFTDPCQCVDNPAAGFCGDTVCSDDESCSTCSADCGFCSSPNGYCGDGICKPDFGENCTTCYADCHKGCCNTDFTCDKDHGESCSSCKVDCGWCDKKCKINEFVWRKAVGGRPAHEGYQADTCWGLKAGTPPTKKICTQCHGNCCVEDGVCPTSSCIANLLGNSDTKVNCKARKTEYMDANGNPVMTVNASSPCGVHDYVDTHPYFAFCNTAAYGDDRCMSEGKPHCLGQIACKDSTGAIKACPDAIAIYEGADCFMDGKSGNFKLCFSCDDKGACDMQWL